MIIGMASPLEMQMLVKYLYENDKQLIQNICGLGGTQPTQLAIQFLKMGHKVSLFTLSQDIKQNEYKIFRGDNLTIYIGHFRRGKKVTLDFQYKEIALVKRMINIDNPDVLSCHWTYEFAMAGILSKKPTFITVRDWSPEILKLTKKPYRLMRMTMSFFVYSFGKNFIPNSPYMDKKIKFLKDKKLEIIPNGIDDDLLLTEEKRFNKATKLKIISINHGFGEIKNLKPLIKAFNQAQRIYEDISLYLLGDGFEIAGEAYMWCQENDLLTNIVFIGKVNYSEVMSLLDKSDLMVHPAKEESFGNILVEAMSRRVPVIAGEKSGAVPWVAGDSCMLVDINSVDKIYKSILYFIVNHDKLNIYSKKGYDNVYSRFRLSQIALKYLQSFKSIKEFDI
jgi:L-malate glycosyltransferase